MDTLYHWLCRAGGGACVAANGHLRTQYPHRDDCVARHPGVGLHLGRCGVARQVNHLHRPTQQPPPQNRQAHPHRCASLRGAYPCKLLEGAARWSRTSAFIGKDFTLGTLAWRDGCVTTRTARQHALCCGGGRKITARNIEQPLTSRTRGLWSGTRYSELH